MSDFSLSESLKSFGCLEDNVIFIDFPKSISLGFDSDYHKVDWDVWSLGDLLILLHQTNDQVSFLGD